MNLASGWDAFRRLRKLYLPSATTRALRRELVGMDSVLDVGCGADSPLQYVLTPEKLVGVDAFQGSIDASRARGIHREYHVMELDRLAFPELSFDAVVAMDVIEHFTREDALRLLARMEAMARRKVIVLTPNGFMPQGEIGRNPWQVHRSGWTAGDLQTLGYRVSGTLGWKALRGELHRPRFRPIFIWERVANATVVFTANRPEYDAALLAVKETGK